ncbi:MAG TPA: NADH-quinone oxidoreductase subunit L [Anaeromyxobacteraceae bacterium]|nr:NADH-quinone oxidoreductase subunit L [Anaeromyxobacteraceae bacterium]
MEHALNELGPIAVHKVSYLWLIPLFPAVGAFINSLFGLRIQRVAGKRAVHVLAIGTMTLSFLVAVRAFLEMYSLAPDERFLQQTLWNMVSAGRLSFDLGFALDPLSMMMVLIITFIGTLIHVFSTGYMAEEPSYWRFFAYLNLFVFAMLLLVMGDNFAVMFFGWEGVGLASYLLISFWYTDIEKAKAGMKAFVVNRFGDFGFILGLFLLFWSLGGVWAQRADLRSLGYTPEIGDRAVPEARNPFLAVGPKTAEAHEREVKIGPTLNFRELRDQVVIESTGVAEHLKHQVVWGFALMAVVGILLFVGAMGKSAQLPLYVWLPDAMAGPTPVSALIHAATMVTAGVYMVARLSYLYALSPTAMGWVAAIGVLTAFFAATIGFFQYDIKKVLAYSTVSQLGFMFVGVGVGAFWAGTYHLLTHAFFKACLFLGSGSVILGCHHEQDMRKMGGLKKHMPVTAFTYLVACWAIAGFPWASGFYSKDEILWKAFTARDLAFLGHSAPWLGPAIFVLGILAATGTSFYMFRSYYMTFTGSYRGGEGHAEEHDEDPHAAHAAPHHVTAAHPHDNVDPDAAQGHGAHGATSHGAHAADAHGHVVHGKDDHGHVHHGGAPHESPLSITAVLVVLAAGAILTGLLGIPAAWTGHEPLLERWLSPALPAEVHFAEFPHSTEFLFQGLGVGAAIVGWFFARLLFKDGRSPVPAQLKKRFFGAWTVVYNKYYVDEAYQALVVRPSLFLARFLFWFDQHVVDWLVNFVGWLGRFVANIDGAIDKYVVDGAVNAVAGLTGEAGRAMRRIETGRITTYLYGLTLGSLLVVLFNFLFR